MKRLTNNTYADSYPLNPNSTVNRANIALARSKTFFPACEYAQGKTHLGLNKSSYNETRKKFHKKKKKRKISS